MGRTVSTKKKPTPKKVAKQIVASPKQIVASPKQIVVTEFLNNNCKGWKEWDKYSGRGMFGMTSDFAVCLPDSPYSDVGQKLSEFGMKYDNMAFEWIYYFE